MATQTDRIERDVLIAAPVERVWKLITRAEHLGRWLGDAGAEIDLRPGGALTLRWGDDDVAHGRIVTVEPPHRFAYRWLLTEDAEPTPANSTLTEFTVAAEGDGTRVAVVESGFAALACSDEQRASNLASNTKGWAMELGELERYAAQVAA